MIILIMYVYVIIIMCNINVCNNDINDINV